MLAKARPRSHSFIAFKEAIVQIDLDAQLLRLIRQLLDQLRIEQARDIAALSTWLSSRTNLISRFIVRSSAIL